MDYYQDEAEDKDYDQDEAEDEDEGTLPLKGPGNDSLASLMGVTKLLRTISRSWGGALIV